MSEQQELQDVCPRREVEVVSLSTKEDDETEPEPRVSNEKTEEEEQEYEKEEGAVINEEMQGMISQSQRNNSMTGQVNQQPLRNIFYNDNELPPLELTGQTTLTASQKRQNPNLISTMETVDGGRRHKKRRTRKAKTKAKKRRMTKRR